jgi:hypothetical protein
MEVTDSNSRARARPEESETLKSEEISAAIEEELAYESDSSDVSWKGDFAEDSNEEHSDSDITQIEGV